MLVNYLIYIHKRVDEVIISNRIFLTLQILFYVYLELIMWVGKFTFREIFVGLPMHGPISLGPLQLIF